MSFKLSKINFNRAFPLCFFFKVILNTDFFPTPKSRKQEIRILDLTHPSADAMTWGNLDPLLCRLASVTTGDFRELCYPVFFFFFSMILGSPWNTPQGNKRPRMQSVSRISLEQKELNKYPMNLNWIGCPLVPGRSQGIREAPWDFIHCGCVCSPWNGRREQDEPGYAVPED